MSGAMPALQACICQLPACARPMGKMDLDGRQTRATTAESSEHPDDHDLTAEHACGAGMAPAQATRLCAKKVPDPFFLFANMLALRVAA